ncbi:acyl-CoA dehydrogenase family protein [Aeromicrobium sp.]|uniref:acyl-CoA dehydrogenase family protein n=1 Tax=Aeromicrobium sp. TaxID=1871063 RepID=UPI0019A06F97|nr:acyl-CoA dehydrogenase family protein [Aeromicrobium sp.]MBC7631590.1 acyl-CoA dehydrogenase family protein [Aeromicrobium sp.]
MTDQPTLTLSDTPDGDFLGFELLLEQQDRDLLHTVRAHLEAEVLPVINDYWTRAEFPHALVPGFAKLGIAGLAYDGPGCAGRSSLADGMISLELARVDPSMQTFMGVHGGLAMGSIQLCGTQEQKERWLPAMARMELIGAFGLTEPDTGSAIAGGLSTTATRDGDEWVLDGEKKWIGNASFADLVIIWARDAADEEVKGFVVEKDTEGMTFDVQQDKIALRVVQNAEVHLSGVRVPESNRLGDANSFADTSRVLQLTRGGVAWAATGCARGAYEHALRYSKEREQFGKPIAGFQLVQDLLVRMLGNVVSSTAMCVRIAQLQDAGMLLDEHASLAKAFTTARMRETVGWAREVLGGNGILLEHHVGRFAADAEALYSYEGTREINTLIVGRAITGESAFV